MSINFKFLVESPDDLYNPGDEPICFGLIRGRWVYMKGMETHQRMMNEIRLQVQGLTPQNHFEWTIFPAFQSMEEENSWWGSLDDVEDLFWKAKNGDEEALRAFFNLSGRLSTAPPKFLEANQLLCAFWDTTAVVRQHLSELHQLFQHLGLDITKYKFDTLDGVADKNELGYFSYKALVGNQQFAPARSPEEQKRLLQIQHLNPAAKKALGNISVVGSSKYAQKAHQAGFPSVASFRNFATQESVIKEDFEYTNFDGWLDLSGKFYKLGIGELHGHWAAEFLASHGEFPEIDTEFGDEKEIKGAWDHAADELYTRGWIRVVRFPGKIHFWYDKQPNQVQLKVLKHLAVEEQRVVIDDRTDQVFFDPGTAQYDPYGAETKLRAKFGAVLNVPNKPKGMTNAQFNFLRQQESVVSEKAIPKLPNTWEELPPTWKEQYPKELYGYPNDLVKPIVLGIAKGQDVEAKKLKPEEYETRWLIQSDTSWNLPRKTKEHLGNFWWWQLGTNNIVKWNVAPSDKAGPGKVTMDAVDSYLLQRGIKVFSHGNSLYLGKEVEYSHHWDAIKFRTPDYYTRHGRKIIKPPKIVEPSGVPAVTLAQWHHAHGESMQLTEKIIKPNLTTWESMPKEWRAQYPKKLFGFPNYKIKPIALGIALKGNIEAKRLKSQHQWYDQDETSWSLPTRFRKDVEDFLWWTLGNNKVVKWSGPVNAIDMNAVDSYLLQRGIKVFSHGNSLYLGKNVEYHEFNSAIKYRTPNFYLKYGRQIAPPPKVKSRPVLQPPTPTMAQWHYAHGESFKQFVENSMIASSDGAFGVLSTPYADGDARVPFALGVIQKQPIFQRRKKKRKKNEL